MAPGRSGGDSPACFATRIAVDSVSRPIRDLATYGVARPSATSWIARISARQRSIPFMDSHSKLTKEYRCPVAPYARHVVAWIRTSL